ncbi:AMP-binding protein [Gilvibacter sp.]|uniref:AMP-binding protein n=1 Tax=Gilvibacter sp. TaxID=2729997 RepID=UPI003F4A6AF6
MVVHPDFKLNGLSYESPQDLLEFTAVLKQQGAAHEMALASFLSEWGNSEDHIIATTSGSTGTPKPVKLSKAAMIHSAKTTGEALELGPKTEALLCLSSDYIAGKMMIVRALTLGWHLHVVAPSMEALTEYDSAYDFVAMVPAQAMHSITALEKVGTLLIGGGMVSNQLEQALQGVATKAYVSYGMTETVSHIALRRLNGAAASENYKTVSGVSLSLDARGCLVIEAPGISSVPVVTNDLVDLISETEFKWLGRIDNVINSGGIKIYPEQVESALEEQLDVPFFVAAEPDPVLGQRVVLVVESPSPDGRASGVHKDLFDGLPKYSRPKKIYGVSKFRYTETGKIRRNEILSLLQNYPKKS